MTNICMVDDCFILFMVISFITGYVNWCMIKIFRGEGVVDGEGGSSERCLQWGGVGGGH